MNGTTEVLSSLERGVTPGFKIPCVKMMGPWRERVRELGCLGKGLQFEIGPQIEPTGSGEGGNQPDTEGSVSGRGLRTKARRGNVPGRFQVQQGGPLRLGQNEYREGRGVKCV